MTKAEAIARITRSIESCEPAVLTPAGVSYEQHVENLSKKLIGEVIDPVRATVTSTIIQDADFDRYREAEVWAIARGPGGWLLTISSSEGFALAFGDDPTSLMMHGCSSEDAVGEWCA